MIKNHEIVDRVASRTTISAGVALLALFAAGATQANDSSDANASCRQETKRVAVWPKGPKGQSMARFENREVKVCDGKVVSRRAPDPALQATETASDSGA